MDVKPASLDLHNKEHLDAPQQHRVDVEEVARQQATRLGTQKPLPAHARQPWSRARASTSQDAPHGALPHPVTQLREFALDPPVPPPGDSPWAIRITSSRISSASGGRPGLF